MRVRNVTTLFDIALTVGAFLAAYLIHEWLWVENSADFVSHVAIIPFIIALWGFLLSFYGAYGSPRTTSRFDYAWAVMKAVATGLVVLISLLFLLKITYVSRAVVLIFAALGFFLLVAIRMTVVLYFRSSLKRGENFQKVLIIGTGNRAIRLAKTLRENAEWGLHIIGHLDPDPSLVASEVLGAPVLGGVEDISSVLKHHVVDEVIIAIPRAMIPDVDRIAFTCEEEGVKLRFMADVFDVHVARMRLVELGSVPLLTLEQVAQDEWMILMKRVLDLAMSLVLLPILLPIMGAVALAIRLNSPGPVLFVQKRVGKNKRQFPMYKFRTMVENAEKMMAEIEHLNEAKGPIFKIANDPRVTSIGKFLRKTSLDELPQIFNVLRGEMSLVGPRPMSLRDVEMFDRGIQRRRFSVKPGITCLWQVSGRSQLPFAKWLELDLYYIDHWSIGLDVKILLKTIPAVLKGSGAV